jgi:hypothetical protein
VLVYYKIVDWREWPRTVDTSIAVLISFSDHLVNLLVGQLLANGGHYMAQLGRRDESVVVAIKNLVVSLAYRIPDLSGRREAMCPYLESFSDLFLGVSILHLTGHHGQEFCTM